MRNSGVSVGWPNTAAAVLALRNLIHDGPTDKRAINKKVIGVMDGTNSTFTTFENRRLGSFTAPVFPLGVYVGGVLVPGNKVTQDDPASGAFQLDPTVLPNNRQALTASYYYQWFLDVDLEQFLGDASSWLGLGATYTGIPDGLNAACLRFAAQEAYEKAAMRYTTRMSEAFQLEDAPSEDVLKSVDAFKSMASDFMEKAETMRDDYYERQGQAKAPNFSFALGSVRDPVPRK